MRAWSRNFAFATQENTRFYIFSTRVNISATNANRKQQAFNIYYANIVYHATVRTGLANVKKAPSSKFDRFNKPKPSYPEVTLFLSFYVIFYIRGIRHLKYDLFEEKKWQSSHNLITLLLFERVKGALLYMRRIRTGHSRTRGLSCSKRLETLLKFSENCMQTDPKKWSRAYYSHGVNFCLVLSS